MEKLAQMLPNDIALDCDIITHSRGGLVGRELIERMTEKQLDKRKLNIRRAVFVAGPLDGTVLADGEHMFDFMDRYTNLLDLASGHGLHLNVWKRFSLRSGYWRTEDFRGFARPPQYAAEGPLSFFSQSGHGARNALSRDRGKL